MRPDMQQNTHQFFLVLRLLLEPTKVIPLNSTPIDMFLLGIIRIIQTLQHEIVPR
jgi:hypothetical protein